MISSSLKCGNYVSLIAEYPEWLGVVEMMIEELIYHVI